MDDEERAIITSKNLFPTELVKEIFDNVKGESAIAQLATAEPMPYVGKTEWIMSLDGEAAVVDEGAAKPYNDGYVLPKVIKPFKVVYQTRVTDEFLKMSDEQRVAHMEAFQRGFTKKIARALDIVGFHGLDPATGSKLSFWTNSIDGTEADDYYTVSGHGKGKIDLALKKAIAGVTGGGYTINGVAFAPQAAEMMSELTKENGDPKYPQFDFAFPDTFAGGKCVENNTVACTWEYDSETRNDLVIVGDFSAIRWGYAGDGIDFEVIEHGDPDGQGDLKRYNQVCLRAEAYIGFGIMTDEAFALVGALEESESESESESN